MYRIRITKNFRSVCGLHCNDIDYSVVNTLYCVEKKRKYWWGWQYFGNYSSEEEAMKVLENIILMDNWEDEIVYV